MAAIIHPRRNLMARSASTLIRPIEIPSARMRLSAGFRKIERAPAQVYACAI
ncbi:MAG: hypothetical protein M0R66_08535 [Candidatus Omnitrophica bacterium]|nr:hypothetical protein [Candidatus Omnitrophota bacterium]